MSFTIVHYAGPIKYDAEHLIEKNTEMLRHDLISVLKASTSGFLRQVIGTDLVAIYRWTLLKNFFKAWHVRERKE